MAILYGTTGDGTTLPVLVDQFGNLLAKGIDGSEGPPGPPGIGQLPPDPYEGALLGWQDGELAWIGGSVPLPAGTYGPFTYVTSEEILSFPQDASALVNGQQLYMSNDQGESVIAVFKTDKIGNVDEVRPWDRNGVPWSSMSNYGWQNFSRQFVAGSTTGMNSRSDCKGNGITTRFSGAGITNIKTLEVMLGRRPSGPGVTFKIDGKDYQGEVSTNLQDGYGQWRTIPGATTFDSFESTGGSGSDDCYLIWNWRVNGILLTNDDLVGPIIGTALTFPSNNNFDKWKVNDVIQEPNVTITDIDAEAVPPTISVSGGSWSGADGSGTPGAETDITAQYSGSGSVAVGFNGAILLRESNKEWVDGFYVTAPEQRIAARKLLPTAIKRATN